MKVSIVHGTILNDIMEKSRAWEANSSLADQETSRILHNPEVH